MTSVLTGELATELATIAAMTELYCRVHHHPTDKLCDDCRALIAYAETRLDRCPYGHSKPACRHCPIHCYKPEPKASIQQIMRYSGPRMLLRHPLLALRHLRRERRPFPTQPPHNQSQRYLRAQADDKAKTTAGIAATEHDNH
ncbi:nitrous oxide-stimulated promoter family protein [Shewanella sp.]|uniref:nitrous oxide-stimulated promoter family protein n=1 Tax=Shewanella sp. TaxID=50422 RepID=UPI003A971B07